VDVWNNKGFKNFEEYMMYYCTLDVDLLIQGLVKFREILQDQLHLEALDFMLISSISYNAALKNYVEQKLNTIENEEMGALAKFSTSIPN